MCGDVQLLIKNLPFYQVLITYTAVCHHINTHMIINIFLTWSTPTGYIQNAKTKDPRLETGHTRIQCFFSVCWSPPGIHGLEAFAIENKFHKHDLDSKSGSFRGCTNDAD